MSKDFEVIALTKEQHIEMPPRTIQLIPTRLYVLPEGSVTNEMSFAWVLSASDTTPVVIAQITARMMFESMPREIALKLRDFIDSIHCTHNWQRNYGSLDPAHPLHEHQTVICTKCGKEHP